MYNYTSLCRSLYIRYINKWTIQTTIGNVTIITATDTNPRKDNLHLYHCRQSPSLPLAAEQASVLTSSRKAPNARQKTSGPAKSVSCRMDASVMRNGFRTARVCKEQRRTFMLGNIHNDTKHFMNDFQISTIILTKTPTHSIRPRRFHKNRHNK